MIKFCVKIVFFGFMCYNVFYNSHFLFLCYNSVCVEMFFICVTIWNDCVIFYHPICSTKLYVPNTFPLRVSFHFLSFTFRKYFSWPFTFHNILPKLFWEEVCGIFSTWIKIKYFILEKKNHCKIKIVFLLNFIEF